MSKNIEITKTEARNMNCNTCGSYEDVYDIRFKIGSGTTVIKLCDTCLKVLENEIDSAVRW